MTLRPASLRRHALAVALTLGLAGAAEVQAQAQAPGDEGVERFRAVGTSAAAPLRQALVVAPLPAAPGPFGAEAVAVRDLLRLLGFDVTAVSSDTRPALDAATRGFVDAVKPGAEVALFLLGSIRAAGASLVVTPPAAGSSAAPPASDFDGIRLSRLLRAVARQNPKSLVVVADGCMPGGAPTCPTGSDAVPESVSALVASDAHPPTGTLQGPLLGLMKRESLVFADLADPLRRAAAEAGLGFAATPTLSRTFAFMPADFLARLPRPCNAVDPRLGADALRTGPDLGPIAADCEAAAVTYAPWPFFRGRLATAREQSAAQKALRSCDAGAASAYLGAYPTGAYRAAVAEQRQACAPPPPPPPPPLTPLQQRATAAVADYYRRHNYHDGDSFAALASLYPPKFRNRDRTVSDRDHMQQLGDYYAGLNSVQIDIVPGSLDLGDCLRPDSCRVHGRIRSQTLKKGQSEYSYADSRFSLLFNLDTSKVLYECAVGDPPNPREQPCE